MCTVCCRNVFSRKITPQLAIDFRHLENRRRFCIKSCDDGDFISTQLISDVWTICVFLNSVYIFYNASLRKSITGNINFSNATHNLGLIINLIAANVELLKFSTFM